MAEKSASNLLAAIDRAKTPVSRPSDLRPRHPARRGTDGETSRPDLRHPRRPDGRHGRRTADDPGHRTRGRREHRRFLPGTGQPLRSSKSSEGRASPPGRRSGPRPRPSPGKHSSSPEPWPGWAAARPRPSSNPWAERSPVRSRNDRLRRRGGSGRFENGEGTGGTGIAILDEEAFFALTESRYGMNKRYHVHISGRVQGVFFRANTCKQARSFGLTGWVRNLPDGRVETVFEGEAHERRGDARLVQDRNTARPCGSCRGCRGKCRRRLHRLRHRLLTFFVPGHVPIPAGRSNLRQAASQSPTTTI